MDSLSPHGTFTPPRAGPRDRGSDRIGSGSTTEGSDVDCGPSSDSHDGTYVGLQKKTECGRCRILEAELEQAIESVGALSFKLHQSALSESALRRQLTAMRT